MPKALILLFLFCSVGGASVAMADTMALPVNPVVVGGSASVQVSAPGQMEVLQNTQRAVIHWDGFNIGTNAQVRFTQPNAQSIAVNRVNGNDAQPTQILGRLRGNGRIVVLDANGVMFGPDSRVDVAGLVASTGDINAASFMADTQDRIALTQVGDVGARVENQGRITVAQSGLAALVAPHVANSGIITANLGKVVLAGAETATLDLYGDGLFSIAALAASQAVSVTQAGTITANGGRIHLTTQDTQAALSNVINMGGVTQAQMASAKGGVISLRTGKNGSIHLTGRAEADGDIALSADRDIYASLDAGNLVPQVRANRSGNMSIVAQNGVLKTDGLTNIFGKWDVGDVRVTLGGGGDLQAAVASVTNNGTGTTQFLLGSSRFSGDAIVSGHNITLRSLNAAAPAVITGVNFALHLLGDNITLQDVRLESAGDGLLIGRGDRDFTRAHLANVDLAATETGLFIQNAETGGLDTVDIVGGCYGLVLDGGQARVAGDALQGLHLRGQSEDYIRLQNGAMAGQRLDARGVGFGESVKAASFLVPAQGLSDDEYAYLAARIVDGMDSGDLGTVYLGRNPPVVHVQTDYTQRVDVRRYVPEAAKTPNIPLIGGATDVPAPVTAIGAALAALSPGAGNPEDDEDEGRDGQSSF